MVSGRIHHLDRAQGRLLRDRLALVGAAAMIAGLGGCASYRPAPLPHGSDLAADLAGLDATVPAHGARDPGRRIDTAKPLTIDDIGVLAILNDPDLRSQRGEIGVARAALIEATILPNPAASFSYGALIGGPGTAPAVGGSLTEDIAALVTRGARVAAARAHVAQVDADLLWQEWQVAQKARQLAVDLFASDRAIGLTAEERRLVGRELSQVRAAVAAGNLSLDAAAPLLAAKAAAEQSLTALQLEQLKNWQALDGLLGLVPTVRFAVAPPVFEALPNDIEALVANLPEQRPDLAALRLGYQSAEENLRVAILGQFPAFALGGTYGSDTTGVVSAGPTFNLGLPVFDRNQGQIATARATRLQLREQYQGRLDSAVANIRALLAELGNLSADLERARRAASAAAAIAATARRAYTQGNLDQRTLTDYETTSLERTLQVVSIERQLGEDRVFIAVELGLGLPPTRLAPER